MKRQHCVPTLLCFSHLRWNFVYQRPQHLLSRAVRDYNVVFVEEPYFEEGIEPRLDISTSAENVTVVAPYLASGLTAPLATRAQRRLLDAVLRDAYSSRTVA